MITVVGSLNMDLVVNTDKIPKPGETVIGNSFQQIPGGKGANQADVVAKLGEKVKIIGCVGKDDMGTFLKNSLKKDGVDVDYVLEKENVTTGVAFIIVEASGNNAIAVSPGANYELLATNIKEMDEAFTDSKIILLQLETPLETVQKALKIAKLAGKTTILNPAPAMNLDKDILGLVDILTPNESELEILTGLKTDSLEQIELAAKILLDKGANEIIVTLGENGCMYISEERTKHFPAYKVKAVDTTAAGDSFNGALAVSLSKNKTIDESIQFAMKVGAMTVTKAGAQTSLPTRKEVDLFDSWIQALIEE